MTSSFISGNPTWTLDRPKTKSLKNKHENTPTNISTEELTQILNDRLRSDYLTDVASLWNLFNDSVIE